MSRLTIPEIEPVPDALPGSCRDLESDDIVSRDLQILGTPPQRLRRDAQFETDRSPQLAETVAQFWASEPGS
jgi:hypothetical protein